MMVFAKMFNVYAHLVFLHQSKKVEWKVAVEQFSIVITSKCLCQCSVQNTIVSNDCNLDTG